MCMYNTYKDQLNRLRMMHVQETNVDHPLFIVPNFSKVYKTQCICTVLLYLLMYSVIITHMKINSKILADGIDLPHACNEGMDNLPTPLPFRHAP